MAGTMRLLGPNGDVVSSAMAMGLTSNAAGIESIGGNEFLATDTKRLYWLRVSGDAVHILNQSTISNQIPSDGATTLGVICANDSGFWVVARIIEATGPVMTAWLRIYRFTKNGTFDFQLPNFQVNALQGASAIAGLAWDGRNLLISWVDGMLPAVYRLRLCRWDDGTAREELSTTNRGLAVRPICWSGRDLRGSKVNNSNINCVQHFGPNYLQRKNLGAPGLTRTDDLCWIHSAIDAHWYDEDLGTTGVGRWVNDSLPGAQMAVVH